MTNKLETLRYEILASNGQVLAHSFKTVDGLTIHLARLKRKWPNEKFKVREYPAGKYGGEHY